jgi:hypothetical protein
MPLPSPNLDDRRFDDLVAEARRRIEASCPEWTDLSPGDPGLALVEVFAFLTETLIYRLNRVPHKAYVEFLRLMGVTIGPPSAAAATLRFRRATGLERAAEVPRGTRVTVARPGGGADAPVFVVVEAATLAPKQAEVSVRALHCESVEGELAGRGTGLPGQTVVARRPSIVAPSGDGLDLVVGVEALPGEIEERANAREHEGKAFRIWQEVASFASAAPEAAVYVCDRVSGIVTFAPAVSRRGPDGRLVEPARALAAAPAAGREIRLWYRRGGGPEGNVAAGTLTVLKDPIPGLSVDNPEAAVGGRAAESLENALRRGPLELHSLQRTVTARDFELAARKTSGAVGRAKAVTRSALWRHAPPGTVEVLLVPDAPEAERAEGRVTREGLKERETAGALEQIRKALDLTRPLGTGCVVSWARYKTVQVKARVVVHREEDVAPLRERALRRLRRLLSPLPDEAGDPGWGFGQALRASHVYDVLLAEPGVSYADRVSFVVEEVPDRGVTALAADSFQPRTWYAGSGPVLFRSLNDGEGWEPAGRFDGGEAQHVEVHPTRPGLLAVIVRSAAEGGSWASRVHVSDDCGESWRLAGETTFGVRDLAWAPAPPGDLLFLATDRGLYQLGLEPGSTPVPVLVDAADPDRGFYAVAAFLTAYREPVVAAAAQKTGGVFLSRESGRSKSFRPVGLSGADVRVLAVQSEGPRRFLWAGFAAEGGDPGRGCARWECLQGLPDPPDGWREFGAGWSAEGAGSKEGPGSCRGLAFVGSRVLAATHRAAVVELDASKEGAASWKMADVRCGLPLRDQGRFHPVEAVAADPQGRLVFAGGPQGVYRRRSGEDAYDDVSRREFGDKVTLPETWLFCSGEHQIEVVSADAVVED